MSAGYAGTLFNEQVPARTGEQLRRTLSEAGRCRVDLALTRNRVSMITVQFAAEGHARIRLHEAFLLAPVEVIESLAAYLRNRRHSAWAVVAAFARGIPAHAVACGARPSRPLPVAGRVYDLREIADEVNARFFSGRVRCSVGWGRQPAARRRRARSRSIRYGSWSPATRTVRINPLLDDLRVPRDFVAYIVFHEMLHAVVPGEHAEGGRRVDHGDTFRRLERAYPGLETMRRMARALLDVLKG